MSGGRSGGRGRGREASLLRGAPVTPCGLSVGRERVRGAKFAAAAKELQGCLVVGIRVCLVG